MTAVAQIPYVGLLNDRAAATAELNNIVRQLNAYFASGLLLTNYCSFANPSAVLAAPDMGAATDALNTMINSINNVLATAVPGGAPSVLAAPLIKPRPLDDAARAAHTTGVNAWIDASFSSCVGPVWSPLSLIDGSMELWFDANNISTISLAPGGSTVTSWTDLVHGVVTTLLGTTAPTWAPNKLNGMPGITFAGGGLTNKETARAPFSGNLSCFAVVKLPAAATWSTVFGAGSASLGEPAFSFGNNTPNAQMSTARVGGASSFSTQTAPRSVPVLVEWVAPGVSAGSWGPVIPYVNGNVGGTIAALGSFAYTQAGIEVGTDTASGFIGDMYELVILNTQASVGTRQSLEGYLCWKWALQAGLPANHPYRNAPP